jgi:hypothetical protein
MASIFSDLLLVVGDDEELPPVLRNAQSFDFRHCFASRRWCPVPFLSLARVERSREALPINIAFETTRSTSTSVFARRSSGN